MLSDFNLTYFVCFLAGSDAFDDWTYVLKYCTVTGVSTCLESSTMEVSIQLTLSFDTSYAVSVRAVGRDGQSTGSSEVIFTTEPNSKLSFEDFDIYKGQLFIS